MSSFRRLIGAAAVLCLSAAALPALALDACATRDSCLDAITDAARSGRQLDEMALMRTLLRSYGARRTAAAGPTAAPRPDDAVAVGAPDTVLIGLLRAAKESAGQAPEQRRALALAYLQAGKLSEAELELDEAIADAPTHAPYWLDLAQVYARQGRTDKAAAALVVADDWTLDAGALRQAYATVPASRPAYAQALTLMAARSAAQAQLEAALAPHAPEKNAGGKGAAMPLMLFDTCVRPEYPRSSLRNEEMGTVALSFLVDAQGKAVQIRKTASSGHVDLDNAAQLSLSACAFKPLVVDGNPVPAWVTVEYVWTISDD